MSKTLKRKINRKVNRKVNREVNKKVNRNKTIKKGQKIKKSKTNKNKVTLRNLNKYMPYIMKKLNNKTKKRLIKLANKPLKPINFFHNRNNKNV